MLVELNKVKEFLPHRDPFLFIDSVSSVSFEKNGEERLWNSKEILTYKELVGSCVVAHYKTKTDHPIFAGHFPGNPILPGVVQVEMMAQAMSFNLLMVYEKPFETDLDFALVGVTNAKFRKPVLPGMELVIKSKCTKIRKPMLAQECEIYCNDELMSQASILATFNE